MAKPKIDMEQAEAVLELIHPEYFSIRSEVTYYKDYGDPKRKRAEKCELYSSTLNKWVEADTWEEIIKKFLQLLKEKN
jgi:hypothetical protein